MNTSLVFCVLALSSSWTPPSAPDLDPSAVFRRPEPSGLFEAATLRSTVIRAQSPALQLADGMRDEEPIRQSFPPTFSQPAKPAPVTQTPATPSYSAPTYSAPYEEPQPNQPVPMFMQPDPNATPYMTAPPPGVSTWGANGPQPYRLGYSLWADSGWLPDRPTDLPNGSKFGVFEANIGLNHTIPTWWSPWLFSLEHQFGYRSWSGPTSTDPTFVPDAPPTLTGPDRVDLPGSVYRLGWDLRFETPLNSQFAPFAMTLAFNPSINSDFHQTLTREGYNFDGRGILVWQLDPRFRIALGAEFWDRVRDRVIPHAGFVWLPDDRWEFNIMWPKSRIQYYCGNYMGEDVWLYANGEYHIESYQIGSSTFVPDNPLVAVPGGTVMSRRDQVELEDYRILIGLRKSNPVMSCFVEGGWVFGRHVNQRFGPDFQVNSGFIGRIGVRF